MCTYEHLVDATLPHGLIPLSCPQLRTITLGGAVTGLGIESTSFRNGLPHESVLEMDVFTGAGEVVTATPTTSTPTCSTPSPTPTARSATPPGCGSSSSRSRRTSRCGTSASTTPALLAKTIAEIIETGEYDGEPVDGARRRRLRAGGVLPDPRPRGPTAGGGAQPATTPASRSTTARSSERETDLLTMLRLPLALGHRLVLVLAARSAPSTRVVRRLWPRRWRRSDVYHRLVGLDHRLGVADRLDRRAGRPERERVVQDVEVPVERLAGVPRLVRRARSACGRCGCARCGCASATVADLPAGARRRPTSTSASGAPSTSAPTRPTAPRNRAIEAKVHELGGHKSLYSEAFYDRETFDRLYDGANLAAVKQPLRPRRPADQPLRQGGEDDDEQRRQRLTIARRGRRRCCSERLPVRFTAYDGSAAGPADAPIGLRPDATSAAWPTC